MIGMILKKNDIYFILDIFVMGVYLMVLKNKYVV